MTGSKEIRSVESLASFQKLYVNKVNTERYV